MVSIFCMISFCQMLSILCSLLYGLCLFLNAQIWSSDCLILSIWLSRIVFNWSSSSCVHPSSKWLRKITVTMGQVYSFDQNRIDHLWVWLLDWLQHLCSWAMWQIVLLSLRVRLSSTIVWLYVLSMIIVLVLLNLIVSVFNRLLIVLLVMWIACLLLSLSRYPISME